MNNTYVFITIVLMGAVTLLLRALPFIAGKFLRRHSFVQKLGNSLPLAIMSLLLIDTLYKQSQSNPHGIWQEIVAALIVLIFQLRSRQPLLSILAGSVVYVLLRSI